MTRGKGKGQRERRHERRHERSSKPATPDASANAPNVSSQNRAQVKHDDTQSLHPTPFGQTFQHFVPHFSNGYAPATRPAHPNLPSHDEGNPTNSAKRKRIADPVPSLEAPAPKKAANKTTRSDLASADVAVARPHKAKQVTFDPMAGQKHYPSAGGENTHAPFVSPPPVFTTGKKSFNRGMAPFETRYIKNAISTSVPATHVLPTRIKSEPADAGDHGTDQPFKFDLGPGVPGPRCHSCDSQWHLTKECHVPSKKDGLVPICPFHNCSSHGRKGQKHGHSLDGYETYVPEDSSVHCPLMKTYRNAVRAEDTTMIRNMLPHVFAELVLNRKRKPICRVFNPEICPVRIAIDYSREFCNGQMPPEMQGVWFYTKLDVRNPDILSKLESYEELGWQGMPPGELEAKSWEQIKHQYAEGFIPPQIRKPNSKKRLQYLTAATEPAAAEIAGTASHQPGPDTDLQLQPARESDKLVNPQEQEGAIQFEQDVEEMLDEFVRVSAKVDSMALRLKAVEARLARVEPAAKPSPRTRGTRHEPIDMDGYGGQVKWSIE